MINISQILGVVYVTLEDAKSDVQPGEVVVTDNNETYHIVKREVFAEKLFPFDYKIVD